MHLEIWSEPLTNYDVVGAFNAWRTNNLSLASDMYDHGTHLAAWADVARSAEENYEPGKLTTFIAYEYTSSMANSENLHRNVIFEGSKFLQDRFQELIQ